MNEVVITKEIPIEKIVVKEIPVEKIVFKENLNNDLLKQDNNILKEVVENLKYRVASCQNEKSEDLEKNKNSKTVEVKKQSLGVSLYIIVIFLLGYLLGRIVTRKKKF